MKARVAIAAIGVVGLGLGAGCSNGDPDPKLSNSRSNVTEPIVGCTYNYEPMRGPHEMASIADLVVQGTIGKPRPGLIHFGKDGSRVRVETDIIPIEASSVLTVGSKERTGALLQLGKIPVFEVETNCAFPPPARKAKLDSLEGREVLAYLVRGKKGKPPGRVRYGPAGKPQPVFRAASVEGILMELASKEGVRNLDLGQRFPGAELSDFLPDERRFPPTAGS